MNRLVLALSASVLLAQAPVAIAQDAGPSGCDPVDPTYDAVQRKRVLAQRSESAINLPSTQQVPNPKGPHF